MATSYRVEDRPDGRTWVADASRVPVADTRHATDRHLEPMTAREVLMHAAGMGVVGCVAAVTLDLGIVLVAALLVTRLDLSPAPVDMLVVLAMPWFIPPWLFVGAYREHHDLTRDFYAVQNDYMAGVYQAIDELPPVAAAPAVPPVRIVAPEPPTAKDRQYDRLCAVAAYAVQHGDAAVPKRGPGRNGRPDVTTAYTGETLDEAAYMTTAADLVKLGIFAGGNGKPYALAAKWQAADLDAIVEAIGDVIYAAP